MRLRIAWNRWQRGFRKMSKLLSWAKDPYNGSLSNFPFSSTIKSPYVMLCRMSHGISNLSWSFTFLCIKPMLFCYLEWEPQYLLLSPAASIIPRFSSECLKPQNTGPWALQLIEELIFNSLMATCAISAWSLSTLYCLVEFCLHFYQVLRWRDHISWIFACFSKYNAW